jgi:hypothetical protein
MLAGPQFPTGIARLRRLVQWRYCRIRLLNCFRGGKRCVETARALHIWLGAVFALHNSGVIASNQIYGHAS